jgi:cold shock CspA family protein
MSHPRGIGNPRAGSVVFFDEPQGTGVIVGNDGREYPFHCTAIADGSRRIAVGTPVVFLVVPGHLGRMEARGVLPSTVLVDSPG